MAPIAHVEEWVDDCATIAEIEAALVDLRYRRTHGVEPDLRTSVLTHLAWVPPEWQEAAADALAGLGERHPSRTLLLLPQDDESDGLAARVHLECYELPGIERLLCSEVVELRLGGGRSKAPASIAAPLLLPDLPVFLRWRGRPDFGSPVFGQLVDMVDRLVVDSAEWQDIPHAFAELAEQFDRVGGLGHRLASHAAVAARTRRRLARPPRPAHGPSGRDGARRGLARGAGGHSALSSSGPTRFRSATAGRRATSFPMRSTSSFGIRCTRLQPPSPARAESGTTDSATVIRSRVILFRILLRE